MADAAGRLSGVNSRLLVVVFALLISWATIRLRYYQIANVSNGVLVLFAHPIAAFVVGADGAEWCTIPSCHRCRIPEIGTFFSNVGPTEFTVGMDCRGDHYSGNVRRGCSHVCCVDYQTRCRGAARFAGLAKLIVRTVQFGPAERFFLAYAVSIEPMNGRGEARSSGLVEEKTL